MSNKILCKQFMPTFANFDCNMNFKPSSILDFFQDVALKHGEQLHLGRQDLLKRNIFWVLTSIRYKIIKKIQYNEPITVSTWPIAPQHIICERNYTVEGEFGGKIEATAEWCLLDVTSHRIVPAKAFNYCIDEYYTQSPLLAKQQKLRSFADENTFVDQFKVNFCDLDYNFHVNNAKYGDYIANYADNPHTITELTIQYVKECKKEEIIKIYRKTQNGEIFLEGRSDNGCVFLAKIKC